MTLMETLAEWQREALSIPPPTGTDRLPAGVRVGLVPYTAQQAISAHNQSALSDKVIALIFYSSSHFDCNSCEPKNTTDGIRHLSFVHTEALVNREYDCRLDLLRSN